jgi:predicted transcriptional regulator
MSETPALTTPARDPQAFRDVLGAELFRTLGHPVRVRVLELLRARKEMSVRELHTALQIDAGSVSQHLGALRLGSLQDVPTGAAHPASIFRAR